jgi:glycosyltransferase involved in cell wall biosynthesis
MKVCIVSFSALPVLNHEFKDFRIGGAEVQLACLSMSLSRLGYDVRMVVGDFGQPEGAVYRGVTIMKSYRANAGIPGIRFIYPRWIGVWRALARADSDVYVCSSAGMTVGLLALFCKFNRRRFVYRVASDSDCDPSKLLITYARDRLLYEYGLKHAHQILVQSLTQQATLKRCYGLSSIIVGGFVDRPARAAFEVAKDIDVLWIANIRRLKRPYFLLEAAKALPQYKFLMAGGPFPGEEDLFDKVKLDAASIPNLTFCGPVPYLDVGKLFDRARLLVNTSGVEGFPNTFLQSWIRGIPVVTTFDPDDVIRSHGTGSVHAELPQLIEGVRLQLQEPTVYSASSSAASRFMQMRFGDEDILRPYLEAIDPL